MNIVEIKDNGGLTLLIRFSDSTTQVVDVGAFIRRHPHPQYNKYLIPRNFATFKIEHGNVVWGKNWDLMFPIEQLHNNNLL